MDAIVRIPIHRIILDAQAIADWMIDVIRKTRKCGLNPRVVGMDNDTENAPIWHLFGVGVTGTPKDFQVTFKFSIDGIEMVYSPDPSHEVKSIRNAVVNNKEITFHPDDVRRYGLPGSNVKWAHYVKIAEFCFERRLKVGAHLRMEYMTVGHFNKMHVKPAMHVLSRATAHAIRWCCEHYPQEFPEEFQVSAFFAEQVGKWFDHVAGREMSLAYWHDRPEQNAEKDNFLMNFMHMYTRMILHPSQDWELVFKPSQIAIVLTTYAIIWTKDYCLMILSFKFFCPFKTINDYIEQFHGHERQIQKHPTCLQFQRNARNIGITHFMGKVKHGNYIGDDNVSWLVNMKDLQDLDKEDDQDALADFVELATLRRFTLTDFAEKASLAYLTGYVLKRTIMIRVQYCVRCEEYYTVKFEDDDQEVNSLITHKEYKDGVLVRPSKDANEMFFICEGIFRSALELLKNKTGLTDKMAALFVKEIREKFPQVPSCHLELVFKRFAKIRMNFEGEFIDSHKQVKHAVEIEGGSNASRSAKQVASKHFN